jgi:hypothetical protein
MIFNSQNFGERYCGIFCGIVCATVRVGTISSKLKAWNVSEQISVSRIRKYRRESYAYPWPNPLVKRADISRYASWSIWCVSYGNHTRIRIGYVSDTGCDGIWPNLGNLGYLYPVNQPLLNLLMVTRGSEMEQRVNILSFIQLFFQDRLLFIMGS